MTIPTRTPLTILLSAFAVATGLAATPQRAVISGAHDAPLTATVPSYGCSVIPLLGLLDMI
jgi:hypothetical protein